MGSVSYGRSHHPNKCPVNIVDIKQRGMDRRGWAGFGGVGVRGAGVESAVRVMMGREGRKERDHHYRLCRAVGERNSLKGMLRPLRREHHIVIIKLRPDSCSSTPRISMYQFSCDSLVSKFFHIIF